MCTHLRTHEGKCDEALKKYNNAMDTYRAQYPMQSPEIQAKWKETIAPRLKLMSEAVDRCPMDATGYDSAMLFFGEIERYFLTYSIKMQQEE